MERKTRATLNKASVRNYGKDRDGRITFEAGRADAVTGEIQWAEYRTNRRGNGLWYWNGRQWDQLIGTCDFYLTGDPNTDYQRIYRQFDLQN